MSTLIWEKKKKILVILPVVENFLCPNRTKCPGIVKLSHFLINKHLRYTAHR